MAERQHWMLVSSPENFEVSRARGFDLAGMKSRHRRKAEKVQSGDRVLFYCTGIQKFAGTATATGEYFEDHTPVWTSKKDDVYPFRFPIRPDVTLGPDQFVPAEIFVDRLQYFRKWPREHWRLAFQGNVHLLPPEDFGAIEAELKEAARQPVTA